MTVETRTYLKASEGMILTNGEAYGIIVYLSDTDSPDNWHEITQAEYDALITAKE